MSTIILILSALASIVNGEYNLVSFSAGSSTIKEQVEMSQAGDVYAFTSYTNATNQVDIIVYKKNSNSANFILSQTIPVPGNNTPKTNDISDRALIMSQNGDALVYLEYGNAQIFYYKMVNGSYPTVPTATVTLNSPNLRPYQGDFVNNLMCVTFFDDGIANIYKINQTNGTINLFQPLTGGAVNSSQISCQISSDQSLVFLGGNGKVDVFNLVGSSYVFNYTLIVNGNVVDINLNSNQLFVANVISVTKFSRANSTSQFGSADIILNNANSSFIGIQVAQNGKYALVIDFLQKNALTLQQAANLSYIAVNTSNVFFSPIDTTASQNARYIAFAFDSQPFLGEIQLSCVTGLEIICSTYCAPNESLISPSTLTCIICSNVAIGCRTCGLSFTNQPICVNCNNNLQLRFDGRKCQCTQPLSLEDGNYSKSCIICNLSNHYVVDGNCLACQPQCNGCINIGSNCKACAINYFTDRGNAYTCVLCDRVGEYVSGSQCLRCSKECQRCSGSASNCLLCSQFYYPLNGNLSKCVDCQQIGVYLLLGNCLPCHPSCLTCAGSTSNCTSCQAPLFLISNGTNSFCSITCTQSGMILYLGFCTSCRNSCANCVNTPFQCTSCLNGLFLNGTTCSQCLVSSGYFVNGTNCVKCDQNCFTCSGNSTNCRSCRNGALINGICKQCQNSLCVRCPISPRYCQQCVAGYRANTVTGQCRPI